MAALAVLRRRNRASGIGKLRVVGRERKRRDLVYASPLRANGYCRVVRAVQRHVLEPLLGALGWMYPVEIERKSVEELQLLVVLKQMIFIEPSSGCQDPLPARR